MLDKNLMKESNPYKKQFYQIAFLQCLIAGCIVSVAYFLAKVVNLVFWESASLLEVVPFLTVLLFIMFAKAALNWFVEIKAYHITIEIQTAMRERLLSHLFFSLGPVGLINEKAGELTACLTEGLDALEGYFTKFLPQCIAAILIPPIILAVVLPEDLMTGLLFLITAPLIPIFMFLIGNRAKLANRKQWHTLTHLSAYFLDLLEGITTLKIFNQSKIQKKYVEEKSDQFRQSTMQVLRVAFLSAFVLELTATISVAIIAVTVGLRLIGDNMMFEPAFFLLLLAPEFYQPLRQLGSAFHNAMTGTAAAEKLFSFFSQPLVMLKESGQESIEGESVSIGFEQVTYAYQADNESILTNFSVKIKAGEHIAIVGTSGAGKSTIFQLLLGFVKPQQGQIYINEKQMETLSLCNLRKKIAYLPQDPYMFTLSVAENIALGKPSATLDEIIKVAKLAKIHEFIISLPQGYQTLLGEGGQALSGGQKQRIAIARAFLQDASLILVDEAIKGLDPETKQVVINSLKELAVGKTMLMITHSLALAKMADKIIAIDDHGDMEFGTHAELLKRQGIYAALHKWNGSVS